MEPNEFLKEGEEGAFDGENGSESVSGTSLKSDITPDLSQVAFGQRHPHHHHFGNHNRRTIPSHQSGYFLSNC